MKNMTVQDVVRVTGGRLLSGDPETALLTVSTDSREFRTSCLFVPIVGERLDAHRFIGQALENGCVASLTADASRAEEWLKDHPDGDQAFILVRDTTEAIQQIAKEARNRLSLPAIGITGSVGKTTTREMIASALSASKKVYKTDKNFNNWLGVPLTLCEMSDDYDLAVLELGLNVPGELGLISGLSGIESAVITNIGLAHIEFYGTQEKLTEEKFTITKGFRDDGVPKKLFLNADDPYLMRYRDLTGYPYILYGTSDEADYQARNIKVLEDRCTFDLYIHGEKRLETYISVLGAHNVLNAAAALAVADQYGVDLPAAARSLSQYTGFRGRLQRHEIRGSLLIDDAYNASPASMKAGLKVLSDLPENAGGRKIAVLGDMLEMGPDSPKYHYDTGVYASGLSIGRYMLIGHEAKEIGRALEAHGITDIRYYEKAPDALEVLREELKPGDIIYLKASHGMHLEAITEGLLSLL